MPPAAIGNTRRPCAADLQQRAHVLFVGTGFVRAASLATASGACRPAQAISAAARPSALSSQSNPCSSCAGVGGQPRITRSTGRTFETAPTHAASARATPTPIAPADLGAQRAVYPTSTLPSSALIYATGAALTPVAIGGVSSALPNAMSGGGSDQNMDDTWDSELPLPEEAVRALVSAASRRHLAASLRSC